MNFGLNDSLIGGEDTMFKLCYSKVDEDGRGSINYGDMMRVMQHIYLYLIIILRMKSI